MNPLSDEDLALGPGEAYQRCMQVLARPHPDYRAAQLFATLSLDGNNAGFGRPARSTK
jgi:hypothetical protein